MLRAGVSERWSANADLVDAIEHVARLALLERAAREGKEDEVEDQLFRFSRILDAQPRLGILLGDYGVPAEGRVRLLRKVLEGASGTVNPITVALLSQTVELLRGESAEEAVLFLAEVAVARRGEIVAQVSAAAELSDAQRTRLTDVLSRIYGHPVAVQMQHRRRVAGWVVDCGGRRGDRRFAVVSSGRGGGSATRLTPTTHHPTCKTNTSRKTKSHGRVDNLR